MNAMEYTRPDGSTYIVARAQSGRFIIIVRSTAAASGYETRPGSFKTRREAVAAGATS